MYSGLSMGLIQIFPLIAIRMSTFDWLLQQREYSLQYNAFCGAAAGLIATSIIYPTDLIRKLMQLNGSSPDHNYKNLGDIFK